jgi:hypothetical protein
MRPWLGFPLLFLGLLFLLMPVWIALGDAAVWAWYGFGLFWAIVIGLLASRWIRVTPWSAATTTASSASSICAAGKGHPRRARAGLFRGSRRTNGWLNCTRLFR